MLSSVCSLFLFLFAKNLEIRIDTSYKIITGKAREIWENGSGGVIIAANIKAKTIAYFLNFLLANINPVYTSIALNKISCSFLNNLCLS